MKIDSNKFDAKMDVIAEQCMCDITFRLGIQTSVGFEEKDNRICRLVKIEVKKLGKIYECLML